MYINNPGHMTKMAAMPIYGKNPSKIFSGTGWPISMKLGMKHQRNVYINHDPVMTLTYFTALQGGHALWETGKTGKMINKNPLQGKIREFENFMKIREKSGNFENHVLIRCNL